MTIPVGAQKVSIGPSDLRFNVGTLQVAGTIQETGILSTTGFLCEQGSDGNWYAVNTFEIDSQPPDQAIADYLIAEGSNAAGPNPTAASAAAWLQVTNEAIAADIIKPQWTSKAVANLIAAIKTTYLASGGSTAVSSSGQPADSVTMLKYMLANTPPKVDLVANTVTAVPIF